MIRTICALLLVWSATGALADPLEDGARIYNEGLLPDGTKLRATVAGGARLSGRMAACARCHRPSGYGTAEGDLRVPDITALTLASPLEPRRDRLLRELYQERQGPVAKTRAHTPRFRPGYAGASDLAGAVVDGVDPAGRTLSPSMPRYALNTDSLKALSSYMADLSRAPDPGVDARVVHFATVLGPDVIPDRAAAMLDVMHAFVATRNREIERELARPDFSPGQKALYGHARRLWRLHVWRLNGLPQTWNAQLQQHYARQPVFAMLGGATEGDWTPIGAFCEVTRLPCLFPLTDWPTNEPGLFTIYLSEGLPQEAQMIAQRLADSGVRSVVEQHGSDLAARRMAQSVATALAQNRIAVTQNAQDAEALVVLGDETVVQNILADPASDSIAGPVLVAGGLLSGRVERALNLHPARPLMVAWRYARPDAMPERIYRLRGWLRARRVRAPDWERTQLNTFLALDATQHALNHLVDRYSREFFIETIEHQIETGLNPGTFSRMSLGPAQRFAARGGGIMTLCRNGKLIAHMPEACQKAERSKSRVLADQ
ncbi:hypothetical protein [Roseovarius sp. Pro17]|uniref:hypothetical protein n=1 Tax=Roseovarius sp. Pro17 TaxID=3108175 RepID=UPI002D7992EF|nr:hypothetical protein [Roseovarius sp. Pro17]